MDLQEWEILPDDGFLEIHDDGGKKIFSRKYDGSSGSRGILPQPQIDAAPKFQFEDTNKKGEETIELELELELEFEGKSGSEMRIEKENRMELDSDENGNGGINLWKWSLNGIGAICTFGVAAATICIVILGSHNRNNQHRQQHQQFQIYSDQKRMKQVVQHTSKLNEAMSAVRGVAVPLTVTRAHFTFGGYYNDGLL
ncbi:hypothetical protein CsSME_00039654 [Camellia sinensis var. sinensis]